MRLEKVTQKFPNKRSYKINVCTEFTRTKFLKFGIPKIYLGDQNSIDKNHMGLVTPEFLVFT